MKNYIIKNIFLALTLCSFVSCEEELNLAPPSSISDANFWQTPNDFKLASNHFYNALPGHGGSDLNSDIQYANGFNDVSSGVNLSQANDGFWNGRYAMLRQINGLLERSKKFEDPEAIATSVAEAKFFRAYEYFRLVRRYGDVPYFEEPLKVDGEGLTEPRTSRITVISNVLADLEAAAPHLPLESETRGSDQGRVTKGAALALTAKVALFEATWAKYHGTEGNVNALLDQAISAANAVINSGEYALYVHNSDPAISYKKSYSIDGNDSREQILARRYHLDIAVHNWSRQALAGQTNGTKKLADMYLSTDGLPINQSRRFEGYNTMSSEYENRDLRMSNTIHIPGKGQINSNNPEGEPFYPYLTTWSVTGYGPNKFIESYPEAHNFRSYNFKHVLRYNEVLVTLAEALFERNGAISDEDLNRTINRLRDRGGVAYLSNTIVNENGLDMLKEIRRERTVELAWDGERLDDLKRWKTAVDELSQPIKGVNLGSGAWNEVFPGVSEQYPLDEDGFKIVQPAATRQFSERNYLFPLPTQQIQLNPALTQNPDW